MTEAQLLSRLGIVPSTERFAEVLPEFLTSIGYEDAARLVQQHFVGLEDNVRSDAFQDGIAYERDQAAARALKKASEKPDLGEVPLP